MRKAIIIMSISFGLLFIVIIILALSQRSTNDPLNDSTAQISPIEYLPDSNTQTNSNQALIQGSLCSDPTGSIPPGLIVAEQIPSRRKTTKYFPGSQATDINQYSIAVDPGTYEIYLQSSNLEKIALYSQYVACGSQEYCTDHTSIQFPLESGQTKSEVNICDYRWKTRFQENQEPIVISPDTDPTPTLEF